MDEFSNTPSLADVVALGVVSRLQDTRVAMPGRVESYDAAKQLADVQPLVKASFYDETGSKQVVSLPIVTSCPVVFPGAGGFRMTFPVAAGDTVLLVFSDQSIDRWLDRGGEVDPESTRLHHLSDGIAIPGLHPNVMPWNGASTSDCTLGKDGGPQIFFKGGDIHLGGDNATDAAILGTSFRAALSTLLASLTAASAALGSASAFFLLPPAAAAVAAYATAVSTAVTAFETQTYLSSLVKVK